MNNSNSAGSNIQVTHLDVDSIDVFDQPMPQQSEGEIQKLTQSIQERGLIDPIVVKDLQNGRYMVLEGRTRLEIVKKLGFKRIACNLRNKSDDWINDKVLPYELELCRRHLPDSERKRLEKEKDKIVSSLTEQDRAYFYRKLTPNMRSLYGKKIDENGKLSREWKSIFFMISDLSMKEQQEFFEAHFQETDREDEDVNDIRDTLNSRIDELEEEIKKSKESEAIYKSALKKAETEFEARAAAAIKKREVELEEKYKEENLTGRKFQVILAEEKKKIEDELGKELKEETRRLKELSRQQQTTQKELDLLKEEKRAHDKQLREINCMLKQKRGEIDEQKAKLHTLANTRNIYRQLEIVQEHIKNVNYAITLMGDVQFDEKMKGDMAARVSTIEDVCQAIKDAIKPAHGFTHLRQVNDGTSSI